MIANGLGWADGDEVLVIDGDYLATVLPGSDWPPAV
jgi:hypothetical protein